MWQPTPDPGPRGLSPIPEYDYYHADDEDEEETSTTAQILAKLTNSDLAFEWSMLCQDCTDCWSGNGELTTTVYMVYFKSQTLGQHSNLSRFYWSWVDPHLL
jgi:hypothetical protein